MSQTVTKVICSQCGRLHKASQPVPVGRIAVCKNCGNRFKVEGGVEAPTEVKFMTINLDEDRSLETFVVGTSHYKHNLTALLERTPHNPLDPPALAVVQFWLIPDVDNQNDENAVAVELDGAKLGYLGRNDARLCREWLREIEKPLWRVTVKGRLEIDWTRANRIRAYGIQLFAKWID